MQTVVCVRMRCVYVFGRTLLLTNILMCVCVTAALGLEMGTCMHRRRHGSQCSSCNGPGRIKETDREHEVPSFHGTLAPVEKHRSVSTTQRPTDTRPRPTGPIVQTHTHTFASRHRRSVADAPTGRKSVKFVTAVQLFSLSFWCVQNGVKNRGYHGLRFHTCSCVNMSVLVCVRVRGCIQVVSEGSRTAAARAEHRHERDMVRAASE